MALPSSGPLSINDIRVELQQSQANSSLRSLSNIAGFSTPDAVSEFYGYSYANYNTFSIFNSGYSSSTEACSFGETDNLTLYLSGSGGTAVCPQTGVTAYTDQALTTRFNGGDLYWYSSSCNAWYYILRDGFIEGSSPC